MYLRQQVAGVTKIQCIQDYKQSNMNLELTIIMIIISYFFNEILVVRFYVQGTIMNSNVISNIKLSSKVKLLVVSRSKIGWVGEFSMGGYR